MFARTKMMAALAALAIPGVAAAQEKPRLSEAEATAVARYAMPLVLEGFSEKCAASLDPTGYFGRDRSALMTRFSDNARGSFPAAKGALLKLVSTDDDTAFLRDLPDDAMEPLARAFVPRMVADKIEAESCGDIERAMELLAPLPAENMTAIVGLFVARMTEPKDDAATDG